MKHLPAKRQPLSGAILKMQIHHRRRKALAACLIAVAAMSIGLASLSAAPAWSAVSAQQQGAALLALLALIAFLATRRTPRRPTQPRAA
jgi:hypothetical protein